MAPIYLFSGIDGVLEYRLVHYISYQCIVTCHTRHSTCTKSLYGPISFAFLHGIASIYMQENINTQANQTLVYSYYYSHTRQCFRSQLMSSGPRFGETVIIYKTQDSLRLSLSSTPSLPGTFWRIRVSCRVALDTQAHE